MLAIADLPLLLAFLSQPQISDIIDIDLADATSGAATLKAKLTKSSAIRNDMPPKS